MRNKKNRAAHQRVVKWEPIKVPKELVLAGTRIGETPIKRVKWLLAFAYMNLDDLSEGRRADLAWEIKAFVLPANIAQLVASFSKASLLDVGPPLVRVEHEQVSDETVRAFQAFARAGFQAAFFEGGWQFERPKRTERISLSLKAGEESWPGGAAQLDFPSLKELFESTSFDLVKAEIARFGICANPRCRTPFVTEKEGKGRFCSPRCSAYVRTARFRGKELVSEDTESYQPLSSLPQSSEGTHRSTAGKKLYARRDKSGKLIDIQPNQRAHGEDIKAKSKRLTRG
jgi:hypothetical protein